MVIIYLVYLAAISFGLAAIWAMSCLLADLLQPTLTVRYGRKAHLRTPENPSHGEMGAESPIFFEQQVRRG